MRKPVTEEAAKLLVDPTFKGPIDWFLFIDLITGAVKALFSGCAPTPVQAANYINWRPIRMFDPWGTRLERHRATIRKTLERRWAGKPADLPDVYARVVDAIDTGKVTPKMMAGLYSENV